MISGLQGCAGRSSSNPTDKFFSPASCSDCGSEICNVSALESFVEASHVADVHESFNSVGTLVYTIPIASFFCVGVTL